MGHITLLPPNPPSSRRTITALAGNWLHPEISFKLARPILISAAPMAGLTADRC